MYRFLWLFFSKKKRTSNTYLLVVCAPIAGLVPGTMPVGANFSFQRARKKGGGGFFSCPRLPFSLIRSSRKIFDGLGQEGETQR